MKKTMLTIAIIAAGLISGTASAKGVKDIVQEVVQVAANPVVIQAVKAQNAKGLSLDNIKEADAAWTAAKKSPTDFMVAHTSNEAANVLAAIEKEKPYLVEFILTDNQGANVAITGMTSDYWQGDEPKFSNAFDGGKGNTYIARPQKDKSSGEVVSQVSVPVMSDGKAIGTMTVGVRINKL